MSGVIRRIKYLPTAKTFEDEKLNIRKITVGSVEPKQRHMNHEKVLILVGATGSGKSTLINGFVNYIYGVQYKDYYRYQLIGNEGKRSQAQSQTKSITAYNFPKIRQQRLSRLPFSLTIIDTPGYGDGIARDKEITKQIKEFFSLKGENGIDHLNGIGFVVEALRPRLTPTQKYIFDSILSIFGNDISKNIFLMVTFADGQKPQVLNAIKQQGVEYQQMFKFNNTALLADEENAANGDDEYDYDDFNELLWNMGVKSFQNFFVSFGRAQAVSLQLTREVLGERDRLECLVEGLQVQIRAGLSKIDLLRQEESILKEHEKDIETNKDFTYTVDELRIQTIDISGQGIHVTNCLQCNFTCHDNCAFANDDDKANCCAMNCLGVCTVCPGKCSWTQHKNKPYKFELYRVNVIKSSQELKKRYEEAKGRKSQKEVIMFGLKQDIETLHKGVFYNILETKKCLQRLDEIALRPNPLSELEYIDLLIQSEQMEAAEGFLRRLDALQDVRQQAQVLSTIKDDQSWKTFMKKLKGSAEKALEMLKETFSSV